MEGQIGIGAPVLALSLVSVLVSVPAPAQETGAPPRPSLEQGLSRKGFLAYVGEVFDMYGGPGIRGVTPMVLSRVGCFSRTIRVAS